MKEKPVCKNGQAFFFSELTESHRRVKAASSFNQMINFCNKTQEIGRSFVKDC
jgi:hypothetical protein